MSDELWAGPAVERIEQWERGFAERAAQAKALAERAGLTARLGIDEDENEALS